MPADSRSETKEKISLGFKGHIAEEILINILIDGLPELLQDHNLRSREKGSELDRRSIYKQIGITFPFED